MKTHKFYVSGTHCSSCKIFIEDSLGEFDSVYRVNVDLKNQTLEVDIDSNKTPLEIAEFLTEKISKNGYMLSLERVLKEKTDNNSWQAVLMGLSVLALFFLLQKSGFLNIGIVGGITPLTSFIIGLIASVSSCLAIVGGLVLSLSAKISHDDKNNTKTILLFHIGRLVSFAILGGVLGLIGAAFAVNFVFTAILGLLASFVMILLGLNLIGVLKNKSLTVPSGIFNFFRRIEHKTFTPLVVGFSTFFLPCGFTQSIQVSALSSGSFISGLLIMFAFSLGTLPMLATLSFGSALISHSKYGSLFFKSAGVVVVGLGFFAALSGLAALGVISPLFNI